MTYKSTRGGEHGLPFEHVLLSAYASDGGLYVPERLPHVGADELRRWAGLPFSGVCARVMEHFVDLPLEQLEEITRSAFATFNDGVEPPLPLVEVDGQKLLETGNGPTLAFKDIGQQVVARLLSVYLGRRGGHANIIVETSGDTGPAAISGVAGLSNVDIFCLYPEGRVTDVQELQMITSAAPNVHVYRTEGDTDDQCEALKRCFSDADFMRRHSVCSINSINWARVMVQSSYYFWAYLQLRPRADGVVHFVVPTGAFGNASGGLFARQMGLPIGKIVCATNANDVVHRTISRGDMAIAPNVQTVSPAMDIQTAYNLERMLYLVTGGDTEATARMCRAAEQRRAEPLPPAVLAAVRDIFLSTSVSDEQTCRTMADVHAASGGYTLDPHSAVGVCAARLPAVRRALSTSAEHAAAPVVCVLTAHPAKFADACRKAGIPPVSTATVDALRAMPRRFEWLRAPPPPADKLDAWAATVKAAVERAAAARRTSAKGAAAAGGPISKL